MLDPSIFMVGAVQGTNLEDEENVSIKCNPDIFDQIDDLATSHEIFISQSFMNIFLKVTDELKMIREEPGFHAPTFIFMRLFGLELLSKVPSGEDTADRYARIFDVQSENMQTFLDIADKIRSLFKSKKIKQYAFRFNIGRGYQTVGPAVLKNIEETYSLVLAVEGVKENDECTPENIEKIYEDTLDFLEFDGIIIADKKTTFEMLTGAGLPYSKEKKPNPDLIDRDRSFLKDKFKAVRSHGFRFLISKLKSSKFLLIDVKDYT